MRPIESTRVWRSRRPPNEVWDALTNVDSYASWWPWLEGLQGDRCEVGAALMASIRAPAGYRVSYRLRFTEVERPARIAAVVDGDLGGWASIELSPDDSGSRVDFRSSLHPRHRALRMAGVVVEPVLVHGHDRIMERGVGQFVAGSHIDLTPDDRPVGGARTGRDVARAALLAGVLSGAPSTAHAVAVGADPLGASRAAGALLGRPSVLRGMVAHALLSFGWAAVLGATLPRRGTVAAGAAAGAAIAALDLGLVGRRFPAIRALPVIPQLADHVAFGALVGAVLGQASTR